MNKPGFWILFYLYLPCILLIINMLKTKNVIIKKIADFAEKEAKYAILWWNRGRERILTKFTIGWKNWSSPPKKTPSPSVCRRNGWGNRCSAFWSIRTRKMRFQTIRSMYRKCAKTGFSTMPNFSGRNAAARAKNVYVAREAEKTSIYDCIAEIMRKSGNVRKPIINFCLFLPFRIVSATSQCRSAPIRCMNSCRVFSFLRKAPVNSDVVVTEFCFWIPRMDMQRCWASMTTATPMGFRTSCRQSLICEVSRSCSWSRRAKHSTTLGILLSPTIVPLGM